MYFRNTRKDVFVPIHLYGQLVQHKQGLQLLEAQVKIPQHTANVLHELSF